MLPNDHRKLTIMLKFLCPFQNELLAFLANQVCSPNDRSELIDKFLAAHTTLEFSTGV